jgi:hypothetical protein
MPTNAERFRAAYEIKLVEAMQKSPKDYAFTIADAPNVAAKMTTSLAANTANLGPAGKAAARACGVKPTLRDIRAYLNEEKRGIDHARHRSEQART